MRFGAKHNDIQRHLGDFIRWQLKLPKRKALAKLQDELKQAKLPQGALDDIQVSENAA
jgi:hypothetical protein